MNEFNDTSSKPEEATQNLKKGSPVKAIIIGLLVDIVGSFVLVFILGIVYSVMLASQGLTPEEIEYRLTNLDPYSTFSLICMFFGGLMTVIAGYICAKVVNYSEYKFALILGFISAMVGYMAGESYYSTLDNIFLVLLALGCALFGAWLYVNNKDDSPDEN
jgi:hypothetical protein